MNKRVTKNTFQKQMNREDWIYLRRMLAMVSPTQKGNVKQEYRRQFVRGFNAEPVVQKQANAGRHAANLYLTNYYEDHIR